MLHHIQLAESITARKKIVGELIRSGEIRFGGHRPGKIYGLLTCNSGKRMKTENRVFFKDEEEAIACGYRPCGHCMPEQYKSWKAFQGLS